MFPLGSVLVPNQVMALHVFEPRYRVMIQECLTSTPEFGVVLIERGHEVGGGDVRSTHATRARIIDAEQFSDGRYHLHVGGLQRMMVSRWLPDDPYPAAECVDWFDVDAGPDGVALFTAAITAMRQYLRVLVDAGHTQFDPEIAISTDLILGGYDMINAVPLGELDRYKATYASTPDERLTLLAELFRDALDATRF